MIGYHYTTFENWKKIKKFGLIPYEITNSSIRELGAHQGVWLWIEKPKRRNHLGNVLRVLAIHNSVRVCFLKVKVSKKDLLRHKRYKKLYQLTHEGSIGSFVYHKRFPAQLALKPISPENISLLAQYNISDVIDRDE